jgi:hypothetical protein
MFVYNLPERKCSLPVLARTLVVKKTIEEEK